MLNTMPRGVLRRWFDKTASANRSSPRVFRLVRYFTLTSLFAIAGLSLALYFLEQMEKNFFQHVQERQLAFFSATQAELASQQEFDARASLLAVYEVSHVNLTRVYANVLWESTFAPFFARAQTFAVDGCRRLSAPQARTCFAELGRKIMALPGFTSLDVRASAAMGKTSVFKIKVFDLRGITIYSSEHRQIGEDKSSNQGWKTAIGGEPASELTHRDRFSAFEGEVENRDLISTYVPVRFPGSDRIVGVFEIYSDVTPLLEKIKETSVRIGQRMAANQKVLQGAAGENQQKVEANADWVVRFVGGLLLLFYSILWIIARNAQRILDRQVEAQERAARREEVWQREKMAALATMADSVSHEVGNPLATISGLAEEIEAERIARQCPVCKPAMILEQAQRIAGMTRSIADFAGAHGEEPELVAINPMIKAICDFLSFDRRFQGNTMVFEPDKRLTAFNLVPDHINEVVMNVLLSALETATAKGEGPIVVRTGMRGDRGVISVDVGSGEAGESWQAGAEWDARLDSARRRVLAMGGQMVRAGTALEILLPADA